MRDILAAVPPECRADPQSLDGDGRGQSLTRSLLTNVFHERLHVTQSFLTDDMLVHKTAAGFVDILDETPGICELTPSHLYWFALDGSKQFRWPLSHFVCVYRRPYLLRNSALELFLLQNRSVLFNFYRTEDCVKMLAKFSSVRPPRLVNRAVLAPEGLVAQTKIVQKWVAGKMSNFDYLMALNTLAGRSQRCLNQYPVFPWILSDYVSDELDLSDPEVYRDLSKPMGALNPDRLEGFKERYTQFEDVFRHMQEHEDEPSDGSGVMHTPPAFHYGTHYSNSGGVLSYMMRLEPYTTAFAQLGGGKFDRPERMFLSVASEWHSATTTTSNVKELIPEFYYLPEFLCCHNGVDFGEHSEDGRVDDVALPPWAKGSPEEFVRLMRKALESEYVSTHLHEWIDLIFGYKQSGPEAKEAFNTFHYLTYHGSVDVEAIEEPMVRRSIEAQILNFGLCPLQLFSQPHPPREQLPGGLATVLEVPGFDFDEVSDISLPERDSIVEHAQNAKFRSQIDASELSLLSNLSRDLAQHAVSEATLSLIVRLLADKDVGLDIKTRRHRLVSHQNCFVGSEAVSWMVRRLRLRSRAEAVAIGQLLVLRGIVRHVNDEYGFKDKGALYRIANLDPSAVAEKHRSQKESTDLPRLSDDSRTPSGKSSQVDGLSDYAPFARGSSQALASSVYTFPVLPRSRACPVASLQHTPGSPFVMAAYADGTIAMNKFLLEPDGRGSPFTLAIDRSAANPYVTADTYSGLRGAKRIRMAISRDDVRTAPNCIALAGDDGSMIISCGNPDQSFCAFQVSSTDIRPFFVVAGEHRSTVTAIAVDKDVLVTASSDTTVKVWDIASVAPTAASSFGGGDAAAAGDESFVDIGDAGKLLLRHRLWGHVAPVNSVAVLSDEDIIASASRDGTSVLFSLRRGTYLRTIHYSGDKCGSVGDMEEEHEPVQLKISTQALLVTATAVHAVGFRRDVAAAIHVHTLNGVNISAAVEEFAPIRDMCITADGHFLITCGPDHVVIRQLPHLLLVRRFSVESVVHSVCLSPGEHFIVAGLQDGQLQILPLEKLPVV
jgi:Beige/BEACH domain/Neurobeachin beta propeller domain/Domain found in Dishevelled, Egl-10, and Pleckstrin (DEP)/PH domain associated with Beige/BEACH